MYLSLKVERTAQDCQIDIVQTVNGLLSLTVALHISSEQTDLIEVFYEPHYQTLCSNKLSRSESVCCNFSGINKHIDMKHVRDQACLYFLYIILLSSKLKGNSFIFTMLPASLSVWPCSSSDLHHSGVLAAAV